MSVVCRISSPTDKQVCPCHLSALGPKLDLDAVLGGTDGKGQYAVQYAVRTKKPAIQGTILDSVARTSSLVRGIAGSILRHGKTKFVRATCLPLVRSWILDAVLGGTDKFTCPWYRRLYPSRPRTNRVCPCHRCPCHLSLVTRNLSLFFCAYCILPTAYCLLFSYALKRSAPPTSSLWRSAHSRPSNTGQYLE